MASISSEMFDRINQGIESVGNRKRSRLDDIYKMAQIKEAGYQLSPEGALVREDGVMSNKEIERKINEEKLADMLDPTRAAKKAGALFGAQLDQLKQYQSGGNEDDSKIDEELAMLKAELEKSRQSKTTSVAAPSSGMVNEKDPAGIFS